MCNKYATNNLEKENTQHLCVTVDASRSLVHRVTMSPENVDKTNKDTLSVQLLDDEGDITKKVVLYRITLSVPI